MTAPIPTATPQQVALIAHDKKKLELAMFALAHRDILSRFPLVATGTTGAILHKQTGLEVERVLSGPLGGDQQIGARLAEERVLAVFFSTVAKSACPTLPQAEPGKPGALVGTATEGGGIHAGFPIFDVKPANLLHPWAGGLVA